MSRAAVVAVLGGALCAACPASTPSKPPIAAPSTSGAGDLPFDPAAQGVRIPRPDYSRMTSFQRRTSSRRLQTTTTPSDGEVVEELNSTTDLRVNVLEATATRLERVHAWLSRTSTRTINGAPAPAPPPLSVEQLEVWRDAELGVSARTTSGQELTTAELAPFQRELRKIGLDDPMDDVLASRTWVPGELVTLTPAELTQLNATREGDGDPMFEQMTLTLEALTDDGLAARLRTTQHAVVNDGDVALTIDVQGTVQVSLATGLVRESALTIAAQGTVGNATTRGEEQVLVQYVGRD